MKNLQNSSKEEIYKNLLGNPTYILAPMVAQSELAWRMLARKNGAQMCFTPMYSSYTMLNSVSYRNQVLKEVSESSDRPLIVQFCANNPNDFLNASLLVKDHCQGVDLNLGCPQHIAKKGHFGAYLQDEWDLIHKIISLTSDHLSIGVSAKIRIFPEVSKSIEYAKRLESAGCSFITVHGRTKEQKGNLTGLADWDQIRKIKNSLTIPVVANGNIQYFEDIERCIKATGVDGVMIAESHLTNPAIFKNCYPKVFDAVEEYFEAVEKYPCSVATMRAHVFRLCKHSLTIHTDIRSQIGTASTLDELKSLNLQLKQKCLEDEEKKYYGLDVINNDKKRFLPHWICQPYVRTVQEIRNDNDQNEKEDESEHISKNQLRRIRKYEKKVEIKKMKRKQKKELKKIKMRENHIQGNPQLITADDRRKDNLLKASKMEAALCDNSGALKFCVDLSWSHHMNDKEISKLSSQLGRLYGSNRQSASPAHVYFSGFSTNSLLWKECIRKHQGFQSYKIEMTTKCCQELFQCEDVVYLTPDAEIPLDKLEEDTVYIVGGLVDETVSKKLTLNHAQSLQFVTRRLPIIEHMHRSGNHKNYSTVLAINQVFDILLKFNETKCWGSSLSIGMPARKGFVLNNALL